MTPLRTLIVDDEALARERLRGFLASEPDFSIVAEFSDGASALDHLQREPVDALFIDIEMPGLNGVQVAAALPDPGRLALIFVTAHDRFALEAFGVRALDYLLKPFDRARLGQTLQRVRDHQRLRATAQPAGSLVDESGSPARPGQRLAVKADGRIVFLRPEELVRLEAADNYVVLYTREGRLMLRETLAAMEARLDPRRFARVNRSSLVNLDEVRELQPALHGDYVVVMRDGTRLPLSRSLRGQLERFLAS
ncbi:LytR/AlgR family response regulator transcription factor [Nibricoccus sp. IMCC34717]|uniref:LytR/AlgR family response regulator transcription factor n=1 Tax=Nibricoccus sp. IMCC34717 TaxID=3034021 RepID=UPI00385133A3